MGLRHAHNSRRAADQSRSGRSTLHLNHAPTNRRRLGFESLEDRRMLAVLTVSNFNDFGAGSLRDAIITANGNGEADTIDFAVSGTINIASQLPTISTPLTIDGEYRITLDAGDGHDGKFNTGDGHRIFDIKDANNGTQFQVELSGLKLTGGDVDSAGGAILNRENLTLRNSTISGNAATNVGGAISTSGTFNVINSTLSRNYSHTYGGAIRNSGTVTLTSSTLSGNVAGSQTGLPLCYDYCGDGGGLYNGCDLCEAVNTWGVEVYLF